MRKGETLVVLGPSGTGKSVLLKHVIGLMTPDAGSIEVDGREMVGLDERGLDEVRKGFGMLFQGAALFDSMTVGENVGLALREHARLDDAEVRRRVGERLEWVGMKGAEDMRTAVAVGRHAQAGGAGARDRDGSRVHPLRRADDRARPDHVGRHQPADPRDCSSGWA